MFSIDGSVRAIIRYLSYTCLDFSDNPHASDDTGFRTLSASPELVDIVGYIDFFRFSIFVSNSAELILGFISTSYCSPSI